MHDPKVKLVLPKHFRKRLRTEYILTYLLYMVKYFSASNVLNPRKIQAIRYI